MNSTTRFPLILSALVALTGTAAAQPALSGPAPRSDVSEINGHPIPVGDHNQYYYTFKRRNISANPLGWIVGIYGVSGSYALNDNLVLRGDVTYYNIVDDDTTGYELSVGLPIYFRRAYSGAFLEPGLMVRSMTDHYDDGYHGSSSSDTETTFGPQMLFGWHWTWDSGLNVAAAAGVGRDLADDNSEYDYDEEVFFNGYFRVGYQF